MLRLHGAQLEVEPWQRRAVLASKVDAAVSGLTVEAFLQRRPALQGHAGKCGVCLKAAAKRSVRHPEPTFADLPLCRACHARLEPEIWKKCGGKGRLVGDGRCWRGCRQLSRGLLLLL